MLPSACWVSLDAETNSFRLRPHLGCDILSVGTGYLAALPAFGRSNLHDRKPCDRVCVMPSALALRPARTKEVTEFPAQAK